MPPGFSSCAGRLFKRHTTQGKVLTDAVAPGNGRRDEMFPDFHRLRQIVAKRQGCANRGGISAAGAVRGNSFHEGSRQKQLRLTIEENVNRLPGVFQVAAFCQNRAAVPRMNFTRGGTQVFRRGYFLQWRNGIVAFGAVCERRFHARHRLHLFRRHLRRAGARPPLAARGGDRKIFHHGGH